MPNPTMTKFGYPGSLIREYRHWCVLLRPAQATLGALVMVCTDEAEAFPDISSEAFAEMASVTKDIENTLCTFCPYQKINYLMLMMVDPDVHFHVLPRYAQTQMFEGVEFPDPGWPAVPDLSQAILVEGDLQNKLLAELRGVWRTAAEDGTV